MVKTKASDAVKITRVFLLKNGRIYLMLRNGLHGDYEVVVRRWIAPGGKVDEGETLEEGAVRECKEELGINIDPSDLTRIFEKHDPVFNADMIFYTCTKWSGSIKTLEPEKFDRTAWIGLSEVSVLDGQAGAHLGVFIKEAADSLLPKKRPVYEKW